ncbi:MAG: class I mannose-6-phosphate isomerase [Novosphingobium sp.]
MNPRLPPRMVERPWGREVLPPPFIAPEGQTIGEVWFDPQPSLPELLVKYIFTSQALSVQVHPSDAQSPGNGKEECWLVIDADPGARLGIGFRQPIGADAMRAAALDGSIEHLMDWHEAKPGSFFHIPPGTVHAIGPGISLVEVQQNSDVTYRLYDYGRPRELHLDQGITVARGEPYPAASRCDVPAHGSVTLVDGGNFRLDRIEGMADAATSARYTGRLLVIPRAGKVMVAGYAIEVGECAEAASIGDLVMAPDAQALIAQAA